MILNSFGSRIKELRTEKMMPQLDLAKASGIDRAQISKIEKGKINVTLETIDKLAFALNIELKELMNLSIDDTIHPFVKWAGGKTQILNKLKSFLPTNYNEYYEPFVGGGALLFSLRPKVAHINDQNYELVCAYKCFKNKEDFNSLKFSLKEHEKKHSEEYYYQVRALDKDSNYNNFSLAEKASRMIYLNKACFNGLYRVNSKGYFNVPSGKKEKVNTFDEDNFIALEKFFTNNKITITSDDFEIAVKNAKAGDFVYFDPPYDVYPDKNGFVDYGKEGFGKEEQIRLCKCYTDLNKKGVKVMLSNHNTEFINELYKDFNIHVIDAKRMINSNPNGRGNVQEVIITNYWG